MRIRSQGRPPDEWESLADHFDKVAESASTFAEAFAVKGWGEVSGRCHDLGKLSESVSGLH
jgi:hypothetical protein